MNKRAKKLLWPRPSRATHRREWELTKDTDNSLALVHTTSPVSVFFIVPGTDMTQEHIDLLVGAKNCLNAHFVRSTKP